uniref:Vacuolar protein sorting-associated protein 52 homolog n=1 Tax=Schistocephalus solidus TaxID=70667 RepID=A0A0X3PS21_SCHSO
MNFSSEITSVALESNLDLREYAKAVERQLETLERDSVDSYMQTGSDVLTLHKKISAFCKTLERMESILSNFHQDLYTIGSDIQDLQARSMDMHQRLKNRQAVRGELNQFLSDMIIPEPMIKHILMTSVTEQDFIENLHELDHKIKLIFSQSLPNYPSCQDVGALLKKLKLKAVVKVREFLLEKVRALRKPLANYQVPQNHLLKYRYFYEFLVTHEKLTAREVRASYIGTMEKVYYSYFKTYAWKLLKLQMDSSLEKDEIVGKKDDLGAWMQSGSLYAPASAAVATTAATSRGGGAASSRPGQFGLGDRAERLLSREGLQSAILIPHAAAKGDARYPVEQIFRSISYALLDTASREYLFLGDFFLHGFCSPVVGPEASAGGDEDQHSPASPSQKSDSNPGSAKAAASLFNKIFARTLSMLESSVIPQLVTTGAYDLLGLMLCVQLVHAMITLGAERRASVLTTFWNSILNILWVKVVERLEAHISSLRNLDASQFSQAAATYLPRSNRGGINEAAAITLTPRAYCLIRPHPVARRYAELAASLHSIGRASPKDANFSEASNVSVSSPSSLPPPASASTSVATGGAAERSQLSVSTELDARIVLSLSRMHVEFEAACYRLAKTLPRERLRLIFLINNFDLVISVLSEKGAGNCPEVLRCREVVAIHTSAYIDQALLPYFGSMIGFIGAVENRRPGDSDTVNDAGGGAPGSRDEEGRVTHIVKGFNIDWKNSIEKINGEIMLEFANFTLGTQIFQALLAQLVQVYHRFQNVMTLSPYNTMPVRNQLVSIHQIMNEIKRFKSTF